VRVVHGDPFSFDCPSYICFYFKKNGVCSLGVWGNQKNMVLGIEVSHFVSNNDEGTKTVLWPF
jgi:hypothetical protein